MELRHTYIKYELLVSVKGSRESVTQEFREEKTHCSVKKGSGRGEVVALGEALKDRSEVDRCQEEETHRVGKWGALGRLAWLGREVPGEGSRKLIRAGKIAPNRGPSKVLSLSLSSSQPKLHSLWSLFSKCSP